MHPKRGKAFQDIALLVAFALVVLMLSLWFDPLSRTFGWIYRHDNWKLDELFTIVLYLVGGLALYSWRRWRELAAEIREREKAETRSRELKESLEGALAEVDALKGLLRICESCQRIRDDRGDWVSLEVYVQAHSHARFFRGLCPHCARNLYGSRSATTVAGAA